MEWSSAGLITFSSTLVDGVNEGMLSKIDSIYDIYDTFTRVMATLGEKLAGVSRRPGPTKPRQPLLIVIIKPYTGVNREAATHLDFAMHIGLLRCISVFDVTMTESCRCRPTRYSGIRRRPAE